MKVSWWDVVAGVMILLGIALVIYAAPSIMAMFG